MPWATYNRGKAISPRQVATRLKGYGIYSKTIRLGAQTPKGYEHAQFDEAFARYLAPPAPQSCGHAPQPNAGVACGVADPNAVAATPGASATPPPSWDGMCCGVADYRAGGRPTRLLSNGIYTPETCHCHGRRKLRHPLRGGGRRTSR
jgi:putative DNA primase/helicase